MSDSSPVILGTRGSKLALAQSNTCAEKLKKSGLDIEIRIIKTTSEHRPETPLSVIDQRDVFTRQLDEALLQGEIDLAVHSMKDVPTEIPDGTAIVATTERHDPADALVSEAWYEIDDLPDGAVVATSSLRRKAQLLYHRSDLRIVEIRGNVGTRILKMREGEADAIVLARAGLDRLGLSAPHTVIPEEVMLPAVGQGALAVTMMRNNPFRETIRDALVHEPTENAVRAERAMLHTLEGGCRVPVGGRATYENGVVRLKGLVASPDGALMYKDEVEGESPEEVGETLARRLLDRGAAVILGEVREARA